MLDLHLIYNMTKARLSKWGTVPSCFLSGMTTGTTTTTTGTTVPLARGRRFDAWEG